MAQIVKVQNQPEGIQEKQAKLFDKMLKDQEQEDEDSDDNSRPRGDLSKKGQPSTANQYSDYQKTVFVQKCKIHAANTCKNQKDYGDCRDEELFQCIADLVEEEKVTENWLNMEMNYNEDDLDDYDPKLEEDDEYRLELIQKDEKKNPELQQKIAAKKEQNKNKKIDYIIDDDEEEYGEDDDDDDEDLDEVDEDQYKDGNDDEDDEELNEEEVLYDYKNFDFLDRPSQDIDESSDEEYDINQGDVKVEILEEKDYSFTIKD